MKIKVHENPTGMAQLLAGHTCQVISDHDFYYRVHNSSPMREDGDPAEINVLKVECTVVEFDSDSSDYDYPEILTGIILTIECCPEFADLDFDDFYNLMGLEYRNRTDFGTAALMDQVLVLLKNIK